MNMKKLIESMDRIEEGCGMSEMPGMPAPMEQQGTPVSMNISLNASGKDHVADLINMMKNAGLQASAPVSSPMLSPRMDMERLSGIVNDPVMAPDMEADEAYADTIEGADDGGFGAATTEPDEEYGDMSDAIPSGDDLHKQKKSYRVVSGGDNPMEYEATVESIKSALLQALTEKKSKPDFLDMDKDGDKKEPMKKAVADKKKVKEAAKPDFLDMDKDGDKKEPMKKAVADKKKNPFVKEGTCSACKKKPCTCNVKEAAEGSMLNKVRGNMAQRGAGAAAVKKTGDAARDRINKMAKGKPVEEATPATRKTAAGGTVTKTATGSVHKAGPKGYGNKWDGDTQDQAPAKASKASKSSAEKKADKSKDIKLPPHKGSVTRHSIDKGTSRS